MVSFLIGAVVTFVTFYIAFIYASTAIGLLAFAEALLLVLAFVFLCYYRGRMDAVIRIPIAVAERGGQVSVQIVTANRSRIPCMRIRYQICFGSSFMKSAKSSWQQGAIVHPGENCYQAYVSPQYTGNYVIKLRKLRIYDLTGLFYINKRVLCSASMQVLPEVEGVQVRVTERTKNFVGDSDVYDDFRPGDDRSEIFDIREFREGDKIQSIHWKLSAKSDELVVREDALPIACPVVLILESCLKKDLQEVEAYLSTAASLVFSLMDAHCPHYVAWYSGSRQEMVRVRVHDEEGYYLFLSSYLEDSHGEGDAGTGLMQSYRDKYRFDRQLYTLQLLPDLTLWQEEKQVGAIDARDWKSSVQKLELIL